MLKKILYIMILSLCYQSTPLLAGKNPQCENLVITCNDTWKAENEEPKQLVKVCSSIFTNQQIIDLGSNVLNICTTKARKLYKKDKWCENLVSELYNVYGNKYCTRKDQLILTPPAS